MNEFTTEERSNWMGVLARADEDQLMALVRNIDLPDFDILRGPEQGLVMVRGAMGGSQQKFNMGEMTVTRCTIRTNEGAVGHAYVAGRSENKAKVAAVLDALLQDSNARANITNTIITPLISTEQKRRTAQEQKSAATKVDFMTMVRGE